MRVGGFRVGVVKELTPEVRMVNGERRSVAVATLSLDKKLEPLARDTKLRVRPRSALGLKYIELQPGTSKATFASGDTIPVKQASEPLEFEDLYSTFDRDDAAAPPERHRGLRRRLRGPRPVDQPRDRGARTRSSAPSRR